MRELEEHVDTQEGDCRQSGKVLVKPELLSVLDSGLQPEQKAAVQRGHDEKADGDILQQVNCRCGCGAHSIPSEKIPESYLRALLAVLTDPVVTFMAGFGLGVCYVVSTISRITPAAL